VEPVPVLAGLLGTAATIIVGLLGFVGLSFRRNGRNGRNPNAATLELQFQQMIKLQDEGNKEVQEMHKTLIRMDAKIGNCPVVQRSGGG
jgi:hypothetical protein